MSSSSHRPRSEVGGTSRDDFEAIARRIDANPIGRLMYGQRELFHSNLLGWYFDALPEAADATFRPFSLDGADTRRFVERERGHIDLVFHWADRAPLVIENKVFSLPRREQLDGYRAATAGWQHPPTFVLLSVSEPDFVLDGWRHVDYAELAERIVDALPGDSSYEVETMRRYALLVADLDRLISTVEIRSDDEPVWLSDSLLSSLSSSQMRAALQKARAQRIARSLNDMLPGLDPPAKGDLSNATPLVEILERSRVDGKDALLGWQLQGDQFRRAAVYWGGGIDGRDARSKQRREELSRAHPEFFAFPNGLPQAHQGRKEFNHFAPSFVYQYVKTPGLTVGQLKAAAVAVHDAVRG
jgi:hypothetical protein